MSTHDLSHRSIRPSAHHAAAPPGRRSRGLDAATVAWWAVAAIVAVVDAVVTRGVVGAAAPDAGALNHGLLRDVPVEQFTAGVAVLAVVGTFVAACMSLARRGRGAPRAARAATITGAVVVLVGCLLLVDATVLAGLGYLPAMAIMSVFSAEVRGRMDAYVAPDLLFQTVVLVGAVLLTVATVRYARRTVAACERCGRRYDGADPAWTTAAAAARWGRAAALVAAAIPAFYAVTRLAWALGIPLGFDPELLAQMEGIALIGPIGLGGFALLGAVLTLGLFQRWGEVFPRWMVGLAGRRVPVGLAVVPATLVAVVVLPAGLSMIGMFLADGGPVSGDFATNWAAIVPEFFWPLWSVALGAATYAYWLRRRGTCASCGRN